MKRLSLNGEWQMELVGSNDWMEASVPGSVVCELIKHKKIDDPYYRDNEAIARKWMEKDYEYARTFTVSQELLEQDVVLLKCYGLDTLADIYLNDTKIASVNDMHRTYEFDIKKNLRLGENHIRIYFSSASMYVQGRAKEHPLPVNNVRATVGFAYLRKAVNSFGWDSEPEIPDMGIWRDIEIVAYSVARMDTVYIRQNHRPDEVEIKLEIPVEAWRMEKEMQIKAVLISPTGEALSQTVSAENGMNVLSLHVKNPQLWWPNGYGEQPLYSLSVSLLNETEEIDVQEKTIGLRSLRMRTDKDEYGESFEIMVNDIPIFAKGGNYIALDKFLPRETNERLEQLFKDCAEAHYTCMRVWGGGFFPSDYFFDLADRYGILIWQDFLFACSVYPLTEDFEENVSKETRDNLKRLRHHASLALYCGNNEIEWRYDVWKHPRTAETRRAYVRIFEVVLWDVVKKYDPDRYYYPSSPSSSGMFYDANSMDSGDYHMWDVWHNMMRPYEAYKEYPSRFTSEFGLQSFPNWKTIKEVTAPEDRKISTWVMDLHQRNSNGYGDAQIMFYVLQDLPYPRNLEMAAYASQVMQAEGIRFGSEFYRRIRNRCAGALYWQVGDCWQAPTWSSIDYSGRWKALHYRAKHFFAPLLLSLDKEKEHMDFWVVSDKKEKTEGRIIWSLKDAASDVIKTGAADVEIEPLSTKCFFSLELSALLDGQDKRSVYLEAQLVVDGTCVNENHYLFVKPKHFKFIEKKPVVNVAEEQDAFAVTVTSEAFVMYVYLDLEKDDCHFSDNYFNLSRGSKTIYVQKNSLSRQISLDEFRNQLLVRTITDIGEA